jgi:hypothetical protein
VFEIQLKNNFTLKMKSKKKLEPSFVRLGRLGDPIDVQVRQSSKAKRIIIKIQSQNVEIEQSCADKMFCKGHRSKVWG